MNELALAPSLLELSRIGYGFERENYLWRQPTMVSKRNRVERESKLDGPLLQGLRSPAVGDADVIAAVVLLFSTCGPTNIARLVTALVVNTVNGVLGRRARSDVGVKRFKRTAPFVADCYAASAIAGVMIVVLIMASALDVIPNPVFRHMSNCIWLALLFSIVAATTNYRAVTQGSAGYGLGHAAVAATQPVPLLFVLDVLGNGDQFENYKTPVAFAGFVFETFSAARDTIMHVIRSFQRLTMPRDVDASPRRFYWFASPLYHSAEQMCNASWPMEGRAVAEMGISIESIIQEYTGR